ncbi:hydroxymethylglutaryl-CoA lyase [Streptomyces sp. NPDC058464]|uniref:hydroxymethylglutaryl-CoA lyase n=1 Tax=Streptomyces sp. NPDC058464 TaxID=3346511 RepID=UPI00364CC6C0
MTGVEIVEVCPRDGLQNEKRVVPTDDKIELVHRLIAAGARRIEVASFVHPRRVPQMADAEAVVAGLRPPPGVRLTGLVLNARGLERAIATGGLDEVNYVVPATDAFGLANQGRGTADCLAELPLIRKLCDEAGLDLTVTLAVAFGCPYTGDVSPPAVVEAARRIVDVRPDELALADTIGCAVPAEVTGLFRALRTLPGLPPLRTHFHQTRMTALANVHAAQAEGVTRHDASAGGLGGCPFAPGAEGNAATEDVAWMLRRSGHDAGLDIDRITETGRWICALLGVPSRSGLAAAGPFPGADLARRDGGLSD